MDKTVFVLIRQGMADAEIIRGIFSTRELAERNGTSQDGDYIEEYVVDHIAEDLQ